MYRPALIMGALFALFAVVLGAFAAHGLTAILAAKDIEIFQKGVSYQFYHSFALLITGILFSSFPFKSLKAATSLFVAGIILFSGSLYLLPFIPASVPRIVFLVTPLGGVCFIGGWVALLLGILKKK